MRARDLPCLVCLPLLSSCVRLDEDAARTAFEAIAMVTGKAGSEAQHIASAHPGTTAAVDHTFDCPDGGTARFVGVSATCDAAARQGELTLTIEVDRCTIDDVVLDGTYEHTAEQDPGGAFLFYRVRGALSVGEVTDGTCEFDVRYSNLVQHGTIEFSGELCGHAVAPMDLLVGILPPWNCPRP